MQQLGKTLHRRVVISDLKTFVKGCMKSVGCSNSAAAIVSEILVEADARGVHSHGLNRLEMYVEELLRKEVDPHASPNIVKETPAVALINGNNALGMVVGHFSMNVAIDKAKNSGIGFVSSFGSNHYGIAGYYSLMATQQNMIGLSFTNTSPLVYPTRSAKAVLGTNPIACSAPSLDPNEPFDLDMATSTVPIGKVELKQREEKTVPMGWGADKNGIITTDPNQILDGGGLVPLGGSEETAGYKGTGLGMMVEIFCAILSGANFAGNVPPWRQGRGKAANVGQCFIAINPSMFADNFNERMSALISQIRDLPSVEKDKPVLIAGDPERKMKKLYEREGVPLHQNLTDALQRVGERLGVPMFKLQ